MNSGRKKSRKTKYNKYSHRGGAKGDEKPGVTGDDSNPLDDLIKGVGDIFKQEETAPSLAETAPALAETAVPSPETAAPSPETAGEARLGAAARFEAGRPAAGRPAAGGLWAGRLGAGRLGAGGFEAGGATGRNNPEDAGFQLSDTFRTAVDVGEQLGAVKLQLTAAREAQSVAEASLRGERRLDRRGIGRNLDLLRRRKTSTGKWKHVPWIDSREKKIAKDARKAAIMRGGSKSKNKGKSKKTKRMKKSKRGKRTKNPKYSRSAKIKKTRSQKKTKINKSGAKGSF